MRLLICRRQQQQEILQFVFAFFHVPHFSYSAFYPTFRSTFPHAEFRILHVRDFPHSAFYRCPWVVTQHAGKEIMTRPMSEYFANDHECHDLLSCALRESAGECTVNLARSRRHAWCFYLAWRDSTGIIIKVCESNKNTINCASTCLQHAPRSFPCQMYTYYFYYQFYDIHNTV